MNFLGNRAIGRHTKPIIMMIMVLLIAGCVSVGPDYMKPDTQTSAVWHTPLRGGLVPGATDDKALSTWWTTLNDPVLVEKKKKNTVFLITGCVSVGPDYVRPDTQTSAVWHTPLRAALFPGRQTTKRCRRGGRHSNDPVLNSLVNRALANNLDLKKARASIREARAKRGVAVADLFPGFDATGSATRSRTSGDTGSVNTTTLYKAGFDATWELDIFGGIRRSVEAAEADLEASQEDMRDMLVSLLGEVALNYIDVRTYQARLSAAEANLDAQKETLQIAIWRNQAGLVDELDVEQARYSLESTRSGIPALRTGLEEAMNRIAVLLGEQPGTHPQRTGETGTCAGHTRKGRSRYSR